MRRLRQLLTRDDGSATLELVIWAVPITLFLVLMAAGFRMSSTMQSVDSAAAAAARAASLENDTTSATAAAQSIASDQLTLDSVDCVSLDIAVDASGVNAPLGQTGTITANITCSVSLSNATLIGLPGTKDITATATVPYDAFKERN